MDDHNNIKMPEELATKLLKQGNLDYRPKIGEVSNQVITKKTGSTLASFFKSGKSLNKGFKKGNTKAPNSPPSLDFPGSPTSSNNNNSNLAKHLKDMSHVHDINYLSKVT